VDNEVILIMGGRWKNEDYTEWDAHQLYWNQGWLHVKHF